MAESVRPGFFAALKTLLATLLASARSRLGLLAVEVQEEILRLVDLLISAFAALFVVGLGVILTIVFLAVMFWEQRLWVFGGAAGLMWLTACILVIRIRSLVTRPNSLFRSSLAELDKDLDALQSQIPAERT